MASVMGTNALATYWPGFGFKSSPLAVPHMATRGHTETDPFPGLSASQASLRQSKPQAPCDPPPPLPVHSNTDLQLHTPTPHLGLCRSKG